MADDDPGGRRLHVPDRLRKGARRSEERSIESAVWLIGHMCEHLGLSDLGDTELLDYGCGVKFTQAILERDLPLRRYVGLDADGDMIAFLRENVSDPRFEYFHIDAQNDLYNPDGEPLSEKTVLPIEGQTFDVICLFSVFTHLDPDDYRTLLKLLRRHAKPDGRLFYTLYIAELTPGGHGLIDAFARRMGHEGSSEGYRPATAEEGGFRDLDPGRPLMWALFSEEYARELIEGTGWEVVELSQPEEYIQHHFVLRATDPPQA